MALGWQVPTQTVNNSFSVTLTSDAAALTGVDISDFRLRSGSRTLATLDATNTVLTQVSGTQNWRLDITLTGTFDQDISMRLRRRSVQENGVDVPAANLDSPAFRLDSNYVPASVPSTPTGLSLTGGQQRITATCDAVTADGGSPVTDYEMQIKLASVTEWGPTWTSIGLDRQHVFTGLLDNTAYDVRVRAVNAIGNSPPSVSVQATTSLLGIEAIDEQFIPLGTTDYDLVIDITGNPDTVEAIGHMEGFNYDYDVANAQLHIRAAEVSRLIAGVFWTVKITKGAQTLTADIAYNVVKPAAIFETLAMLHLYKGVPINIDILIQNIPNLIVPNARLLGLKSELQEYGMNIKGALPADAHLTVNEGDISMIVPSETGGTSEMHEYPYQIESGTPPAIGATQWIPKGNYGALTFSDVNHALGYEWTLETGDAVTEWNFFNSTRQVIDPGEVEVTPGNLDVTLKFPNVAGASSYEYSLEGENYERDWTRFVGTFANGMITTIIPDLPDSETLTLRVRVASPWIGPAISIQITGGRLAYVIHDAGASRTNSSLYVFHTGVPHGSTATRIKRILLPTGLIQPQGVAISGDLAYVTNNVTTDKAVYVFNHANTADGDRATVTSKLLWGPSRTPYYIAVYGDELYISSGQASMEVYDRNSVDGEVITQLRSYSLTSQSGRWAYGASVLEHNMFWMRRATNGIRIYSFDKQATSTSIYHDFTFYTPSRVEYRGLSVIGDNFYSVRHLDNSFYSFKRDPDKLTESLLTSKFALPTGLANARGLDIPSGRE